MLTAPIPVWTTPEGDTRLALLDLGTLFHRGEGAPRAVRLWNSLGQTDAPTMRGLTLQGRGLDAYTHALIESGYLWVWRDAWQSLESAMDLPDLAAGEGVDLWMQLRLPLPIEDAPSTGRLFGELLLTWDR